MWPDVKWSYCYYREVDVKTCFIPIIPQQFVNSRTSISNYNISIGVCIWKSANEMYSTLNSEQMRHM